jgi:hypothetical protein
VVLQRQVLTLSCLLITIVAPTPPPSPKPHRKSDAASTIAAAYFEVCVKRLTSGDLQHLQRLCRNAILLPHQFSNVSRLRAHRDYGQRCLLIHQRPPKRALNPPPTPYQSWQAACLCPALSRRGLHARRGVDRRLVVQRQGHRSVRRRVAQQMKQISSKIAKKWIALF